MLEVSSLSGIQSASQRRRLNEEGASAQNPVLVDSDSSNASESDEEDEEFHHPGDLEPDEDNFADHDDECHGDRYGNWCKREYPDLYFWDCCGQAGDSRGCVRGIGDSINEKYASSPEPSQIEEAGRCHPGELEIDLESSTWYDWDEDCHGKKDTKKTHRREFPEGFTWNCCGKEGTYASGCEEGDSGNESDDDDDDDDDDVDR